MRHGWLVPMAISSAVLLGMPVARASSTHLPWDAFTLLGSAQVAGNHLVLTRSNPHVIGAAWLTAQQRVKGGFRASFRFRITNLDSVGSDGFAFVVQNDELSETGGDGGGLGYAGIPNSLAVEFDTSLNREYGDPNDNHLSVHTRGVHPNSAQEFASIGSTTAIPNLSNGLTHNVRIRYRHGTLTISIDGQEVLSVLAHIGGRLNLNAGMAWIGFTAATGDFTETHKILSFVFR